MIFPPNFVELEKRTWLHGYLVSILTEPEESKCVDMLVEIYDAGKSNGEWGSQPTLMGETKR